MKTNTFLTGSVLAVAVLGCGGVSGIPIEKTATDFAHVICDAAYKCCTPETLMGNDAAGMSEPECEMKTAQNFRNQLQNMQNSENAGRSKYNQMQVDRCLEALRAAQCSTLTSIRTISGIPECDSTFATPLVAVGGTCQNAFECIDSVCVDGKCGAGATVNQSCAGGAVCGQNLFCDPRDGNNATDDVCVVEQEIGGACVDNFDCKSRLCSGGTCMQPAAQCFYGGGCAAAGGRPSVAALLLMGLFVGVALSRTRKTTR
ncbi:MAG TPA: hypothetical protein VN903_16965 [Polyangia bacterium]|nr:hypothetical protein [Polyangia bacterium]